MQNTVSTSITAAPSLGGTPGTVKLGLVEVLQGMETPTKVTIIAFLFAWLVCVYVWNLMWQYKYVKSFLFRNHCSQSKRWALPTKCCQLNQNGCCKALAAKEKGDNEVGRDGLLEKEWDILRKERTRLEMERVTLE